MSSPKDPKPEDPSAARRAGSALEHTFLGVAPTPPETPAAAGSGGGSAGGSAIIAAPMISVSGDRGQRVPTAAPPAAAQPAAARTSLQGGWQSASMPRTTNPDQTALHGTPGAWPAPGPAHTPAPSPVIAPRPVQPPRPDVPRQLLTPQPAPNPAAPGAGLQHTALASDYLRTAREVAFGAPGGAAPQPTPRAPAAYQQPAFQQPVHQQPVYQQPVYQQPPLQQTYAPSPAPQPQAYASPAQGHAPQQPSFSPSPAHHQQSYAPQRIAAPPHSAPPTQPPMDIPVNLAESFVARPPAPPPTLGPPSTAELSEQRPLPIAVPVAAPPIYPVDHELAHGPRSIGTQASVAPPMTDPSPIVSPAAPARPMPAGGMAAAGMAPAGMPAAGMAAAASPVRNLHVPANPMAGTMLERTPSIPGGALLQPLAPGSVAASAHGGHSTRFEQVPSARGSLQATGFGLQIPIDQSATDWGRTGTEPAANMRGKGKPQSQLRMILLAALALAAVGFATFGKQLFPVQSRSPTDGIGRTVASRDPRAPTQATLNNLPAAPEAAQVPVAAATAPAAAPLPAPAPSVAGAAPVAAAPVAAAVPAAEATADAEEPADPGVTKAAAKAAAEAGKAAEEAATPESRLAARAGSHVLAARYVEALPLYRELQHSYPQNTAYAAMIHVLEQKTGAAKPAQP